MPFGPVRRRRELATPKVNPFVGLFVAIVTALAAFVAPVVMLPIAQGERLAGIEARMDGIETGQAEMRGEISDVRDGLVATNAHLVRIETVQAEHGQRLTRIEAGLEAVQSGHGARLGRIEDGQTAVHAELSATNERLARAEGTVAGALGRGFPERMAQAPEPEAAAKRAREAARETA